jgi:TolB-like protein/Flp pilus assembly protein TadD
MVGEEVSHYRIVEYLGGGGMGEVYRAEDTRLGRTVALKFLPREWSRDPGAKERFTREAKAASALDHPNVCVIHDIDETEEGRLFIVMAFYAGETLKKKIERGPLPIEEALDYATQIAEGLAKAHDGGIVHRDIKPANVLVTEEGTAKIVDFGLAKLAGQTQLTKTGNSLGTPAYMSPEQVQGQAVDHRTDLWSLGVVLYEMLTGHLPFRGKSPAAVMLSILNDEPTPAGALRPDLSESLQRILALLLQKDPGLRYSDAESLAGDIQLAGSRDVSLSEMPTEWIPEPVGPERKGGRWGLIALLVSALALGMGGYALWRALLGPPAERTQEVSAPAREELKRIVILPFENLGPPEDQYFADGMTEEITSRLTAVRALRVISRTSATQYDRTGRTMKDIGEDLGVGYVLEGTVRWAKSDVDQGRVRITPQLIRVADDSHLWSERYDRVLDDILEVQADIAKAVVTSLDVTLLEPERQAIEARLTDNLEAYQAYLRGLDYLDEQDLSMRSERAIPMFQRAVELDPEFAAAHARLSMAHSIYSWLGFDSNARRIASAHARGAAERAMELAPDLPEVHMAMGYYRYYGETDYEGALLEFAKAAAALPGNGEVMVASGYALRRLGRWEEAASKLEEAIQLDPLAGVPLQILAEAYRFLRNNEEADRCYDRAISLFPDQVDVYLSRAENSWLWKGDTKASRRLLKAVTEQDDHSVLALWFFQEAYERNWSAALERLSAAPDISISPVFLGLSRPKAWFEGLAYLWMGEPEKASAAFARALPHFEQLVREEQQATVPAAWAHSVLGRIYAALGRDDDALREGRRALELLPVEKDARDATFLIENMAVIHTRLGNADRALDLIEQLLSMPAEFSVPMLELSPEWDPLRDHPRYREIVEKYG